MLIALTFAHVSSGLLLKEQMIILVKTTLNNAGHIDPKLIDFSEIYQKKSSEIGLFLLIVSWRSFPPRNFPWNRPIFLRICPWKSFEIWLFPLKSREIGRFFREFAPENPAKSSMTVVFLATMVAWTGFALIPMITGETVMLCTPALSFPTCLNQSLVAWHPYIVLEPAFRKSTLFVKTFHSHNLLVPKLIFFNWQ